MTDPTKFTKEQLKELIRPGGIIKIERQPMLRATKVFINEKGEDSFVSVFIDEDTFHITLANRTSTNELSIMRSEFNNIRDCIYEAEHGKGPASLNSPKDFGRG